GGIGIYSQGRAVNKHVYCDFFIVAHVCKRKGSDTMIIESSNIQMGSFHREVTENIKFSSSETSYETVLQTGRKQQTELPVYPFSGVQWYQPTSISSIPKYNPSESIRGFQQKLFHYLLEQMRNLLDGKNFKSFQNQNDFLSYDSTSGEHTIWRQKQVSYSYHAEYEYTAFDTQGVVQTKDGRSLTFNLSLEMSRSFIEETGLTSIAESEILLMKDPLVINLDTSLQIIEDQVFTFDLDCDGVSETLSSLGKNSGFLALDKNGDGTINDGSELFGAQTGNSFEELAQYDEDGNGWIDENDAVYSRLQIWTHAGTSNERLLSLKDADIGAIFLGSLKTSMQLKSSDTNESIGEIQRTGIYLHESTGQAGTIQHVDFAI
ncbi:MAG: hypothetical protein J5972_04760, partial [Eubacterium sp.]|nr:hypothetical protein [Eubacterium sp.]